VAAIGGHDTLVFKRQELVNHDEDAFDHLLTGNGYTVNARSPWWSAMRSGCWSFLPWRV
jgi:hypothetical protein